ncbi:zinc-ribbon domain protein [Rhynchospora pubera]|uniref:Zinc-ribbon domain protein n=1 Tax=Rhynchospora pubera TaxID=906938 RepID=A0AAV8G5R5_9POAL|nr:zinc-ribbon domain protein [Rhynchospora pubera]KAJ4799449.1 zinc-ribbon domain protein [Rhynchospora pubera]
MFFFFVGGVQPAVGRVLKEAAGRCLRCGGDADLVETQKVLKLFFVPVWRWQSKDSMYYCRDCSFLFPHSLPNGGGQERDASYFPRDSKCRACARGVDPKFRFCPYCGSSL